MGHHSEGSGQNLNFQKRTKENLRFSQTLSQNFTFFYESWNDYFNYFKVHTIVIWPRLLIAVFWRVRSSMAYAFGIFLVI